MTKILIVEDNEMNRDMLSRRLSRKGYDIEIAVDGAAGEAGEQEREDRGGARACLEMMSRLRSSLFSRRSAITVLTYPTAAPGFWS